MIPLQKAHLSEITETWSIFREMGRMPDMPFWRLGQDQYPANVREELADANNTE